MVSKNLRMARRFSAIALAAVIVASCSTLEVGSDYDRQASFANYHTFAMMPREYRALPNPPKLPNPPQLPNPAGLPNLPGLPNPPGLPNAPQLPNPGTGTVVGVSNPLVAQHVQDAIPQELVRKGYQQVNDPAAADFTVDFTIGSQNRTDISSYPRGPEWWGSGIDVRHVQEGALSIDIFDTRTHRAIWYGWAKKDLSRQDMEQSEQSIREAVAAVLAKFPPQ